MQALNRRFMIMVNFDSSPLGSTLANLRFNFSELRFNFSELEDEIIKKLVDNSIIKSSTRYADTLVQWHIPTNFFIANILIHFQYQSKWLLTIVQEWIYYS